MSERPPQRVSDEWVAGVIASGAVPTINLVSAPKVCMDLRDCRAELTRMAPVVEAAKVVRAAWDRVCKCNDEFMPEYPHACDEWQQSLDGAIEKLVAAVDALEAVPTPETGDEHV